MKPENAGSAGGAAEASPGGEQASFRLIFGLALVVAAALFAVHGENPLTVGWDALRLTPDDAARVVEVRDLLAGQGWFDLRQMRLGVDAPVDMHWSRLVDAPMAALTLAFEAVTSPGQAERATAVVWPWLLALAWAVASLAIAGHMAGRRGVVCGAVLFVPYVLGHGEFWPGQVDHHNVQTLLVVAIAWAAFAAGARPWLAGLAGLLAAASIAVGLETLPLLAVASGVLAVHWAWSGGTRARAMALWYGGGLAVGVLAALFGTIPPGARFAPLCDQLSLAIAVPALLGALGLVAVVAILPAGPGARIARLGATAAVGVVAAGVAVALFPQCLGGPYGGFDAELHAALNVVERRSVASALDLHLGNALYAFVLWPATGLAGLIGAVWGAGRRQRVGSAMLLALALAATAMGLAEIRFFRFATPLTLFGGVWLLALVSRWRGAARAAQPAVIALLLIVLTPAGYLIRPGFMEIEPETGERETPVAPAPSAAVMSPGERDTEAIETLYACMADEELAVLAALPTGRVMTSPGMGAYVLLKTDHHAISATYHRNVEGWRAGHRFERLDPEAAREMIAALEADYVLTCPGRDRLARFPGNLPGEIAAGRVPEWLEEVPGGELLKVFRVLPSVGEPASATNAALRD